MAGTVFVLRGSVSLTRSDGSELAVLPTIVVTTASVVTNQQYHLVLDPGEYVLEALPAGATPSPDSFGPYAQVTVRANVTSFVSIPNDCK